MTWMWIENDIPCRFFYLSQQEQKQFVKEKKKKGKERILIVIGQ